MVRWSGAWSARGLWLVALGVVLGASSLGCRGAVDGPASPARAARWNPRYVELTADRGDPNQNLGMVFRIRGTWLAALALAGAGDAAPGAVYLFERDGDRWTRRQRLVAPGGHPGDSFGLAMDFIGSTLVVSAPAQRDRGVRSGLVHVFERQGGRWAPVASLSSPDPVEQGGFGHHVAVDGRSIVVGESRATSDGWPPNRAVYAFEGEGARWRLQATLDLPEDLPPHHPGASSHGFGYYFDLDGDSLAIGAPGADAVLLYRREGDAWRPHQSLAHPAGRLLDPPRRAKQRGGSFGRTLDLDGDLLVVGALRADGDVPDAGAAYVYRRLQGAWHLEDRLVAPDGATNDMFGHWVAHDGGLILSGAFRHRGAVSREAGAAYLFAHARGGWRLLHKLVAPGEPSRQNASYTVDLDAGTALMSGGRSVGADTTSGGFHVVDVSRAAATAPGARPPPP